MLGHGWRGLVASVGQEGLRPALGWGLSSAYFQAGHSFPGAWLPPVCGAEAAAVSWDGNCDSPCVWGPLRGGAAETGGTRGPVGTARPAPAQAPSQSLQVQPPGAQASADQQGPGRRLSEPQPLWRCRQRVDTHARGGVPAVEEQACACHPCRGPSLLASLLLGHKGTAHTGVGSGPQGVGGGAGVAPGALAGVCQDGLGWSSWRLEVKDENVS